MADWKEILLNLADNAEDHFDELKGRLQRKLSASPLMIMPYLSYGSRERAQVRGRALADKGITTPQDNDSLWKNLLNSYRRLQTDEIPFATVRVRFAGQEQEIQADEEGFFTAVFEGLGELAPEQVFFPAELELLDAPGRGSIEDVQVTGQVIIPHSKAEFGVISDMDDTVMRTDVLNLLRMARNTFLGNARTRLPFEGVAAFYKALQVGTQHSYNPIFYVSSSPWNLYDLFMDFFEVREIPLGAMFLKDLGLSSEQFIDAGHESHKVGAIETLLETYPHLPFVLIGDSGQHDAEIYSKIAHRHAERIRAIYIRDVNRTKEREMTILDFARHTQQHGTELLLVPDTYAAAEHAAEQGLILPEALAAIREERDEDAQAPNLVEQLTGKE